MSYPRIASLKTADAFLKRLGELNVTLPFDRTIETGPAAPLAQPLERNGITVGNRFCILPMEGWDGTLDGRPTDLTRRRWANFGQSGAKLIWGGEAVAVRHDGRANPNQLCIGPHAEQELASLRETLVSAHAERFGKTDDLFVGLQLTHSGRYARPNPGGRWEPMTAYAHPVLDRRFAADIPVHRFTDDELLRLSTTSSRPRASRKPRATPSSTSNTVTATSDTSSSPPSIAPAHSVARSKPAPVSSAASSTASAPKPQASASAFASPRSTQSPIARTPPKSARPKPRTIATPTPSVHCAPTPTSLRWTTAELFLRTMESLGIDWVCLTAGSPYYNPHIQRPALFPPSDGYLPPEDPLVGVARQIAVVGMLKREFPRLAIVGSGYSYLQEWLPAVGQAAVREGLTDFVGLGRMVLSYPELPADVLAGKIDDAAIDLPHVQRLHQRPAQRTRLRLLPARPLL